MLTVDMVRAGARRHGNRPAVRVGDRALSFTEVDRTANQLAHVLAGLGVTPGSRLGLLEGNELMAVPMDFACLKAGVVRVPLNARLSLAEHTAMIADARVATLVYSPALADRAEELAAQTDHLALLCLGAGGRGHLDLLAAATEASSDDPAHPASAEDPVLALYTSGTTGTLKAAVHTQGSYAAIVRNILTNLVSPGREDAMVHAAPLIHASGTFVLPFWLRGGCSVVLPGFAPEEYLDALRRHHVTHANLVPTMLGMLLAAGATAEDRASLTQVVYGASPMPRPVIEAAMDLWGPVFTQYYGQTEAPLALTVLSAADHVGPDAPLGACGWPSADVELVAVDADGHPVGVDEPGELVVRCPSAMAGYLGAPELSATTLLTDGWVRTRDVARIDERGLVHLVDRTSDMIITGGYNVYPREVEDALLTHPGVASAAVVGTPDPVWVESIVAYVVTSPGGRPDPEELTAHVRTRLAGYKVPKRIEYVDALPMSGVGKVLRRALRDPLWAGADQPRPQDRP
ncbi:MAG: class I adenylate-forming enzyme family protein [Actinomycetes bacterium]